MISIDRSIIPACDVSLKQFKNLVKQTKNIKEVSAYKIGFELGLAYGLPKVVKDARKYTDKPLIYDHQKAGTDVPFTGKKFAKVCKDAGIDSVILFPLSGPETQKAWTNASLEKGLDVIIGVEMTHDKYFLSDEGYVADDSVIKIVNIALSQGVSKFVVPGDDIAKLGFYDSLFNDLNTGLDVSFYSPGFGVQGGKFDDLKFISHPLHLIIGRYLYESKNVKKTVEEIVNQL